MTIFGQLAAILALALIFAGLMRFFKLPLLLGYILTGIVAGPFLLNFLNAFESLELFANVGVIFLLFIIGLELNPQVVRQSGKTSILGALGQIIFTTGLVFLLMITFSFSMIEALLIGFSLSLSSTIVILKVFNDKKVIHQTYAQITLGILLMQDLIGMLALIILAIVSQSTGSSLISILLNTFLQGGLLIVIIFAFKKLLLSKLMLFFASSKELLFLFSLAWGLILAGLFSLAGLSAEIGALIAGITLSTSPLSTEMSAKLKPLRDFFIIIFFVMLGTRINLDMIGALLWPTLSLVVFTFSIGIFIIMLVLKLLGYTRKNCFLVALSLAQVSEFSLILMSLAFSNKLVGEEAVSLVNLVAIFTIALSAIAIKNNDKIYTFFAPVLNFILKPSFHRHSISSPATSSDALILGFDRVGEDFLAALIQQKFKPLIIDFNPEAIAYFEQLEINYIFGDATNPDFFSELPLSKIKIVISTLPNLSDNLTVLQQLRTFRQRPVTLVLAQTINEAILLYEQGASYVMLPHFLCAQKIANKIVKHGANKDHFLAEQTTHLSYLKMKLQQRISRRRARRS